MSAIQICQIECSRCKHPNDCSFCMGLRQPTIEYPVCKFSPQTKIEVSDKDYNKYYKLNEDEDPCPWPDTYFILDELIETDEGTLEPALGYLY